LGAIGVKEVIDEIVLPSVVVWLVFVRIPTKVEGSETTSVVPGGSEIGKVRGKFSGSVTGNGRVRVTVVGC
jgi:energy-converting hydrogenase Eha subunit B